MTSMRAFFKGLGASLPIASGYVPVAFSFGIAALEAGLSPATAMLISLVVFAGASQFLLISLMASGASSIGVLISVLLMNARHLFYGQSIADAVLPVPARQLPLLAFGLTDEVFAVAMARLDSQPQHERAGWFIGLQAGAYGAWLAGTALGLAVGAAALSMAPSWLREALGFTAPALFFALLLKIASTRSRRQALLTSACVTAVLMAPVGSTWALLAGLIAGALQAVFFGRSADVRSET